MVWQSTVRIERIIARCPLERPCLSGQPTILTEVEWSGSRPLPWLAFG